MKNKDKCKVLHLGQQNQRAQHRLRFMWLGSSNIEGDLWVLVDNQHTVAMKANRILGCSHRGLAAEIEM